MAKSLTKTLTIETVSHRGDVHILAVSDKIKLPRRTRVATSLHYPADLSPDTLDRVHALAGAAVLMTILREFHIDELLVSETDILDGLAASLRV